MTRVAEYPFPYINSLYIVYRYSGRSFCPYPTRTSTSIRGSKLVATHGGTVSVPVGPLLLDISSNSEKRHGRAVGCISFLPPFYCELTCRYTGERFQVRELRLTAAMQHAGEATLALKSRRERSEIAQTGCVTFLTTRAAASYTISVVYVYVCMHVGPMSVYRRKFIFAHPVYLQGLRVKFGSRSRPHEQKGGKCVFLQWKNSIDRFCKT